MLERSHPAVAEMLEDARDELLSFTAFPSAHWQQIWSTNPLERLNKEIKRRTDVVGTFPNPAALLRLAGHILIEQHDEWDSADRRYFSDASMALLNTTAEEDSTPELIAAESETADLAGVEKLHHSEGRHPRGRRAVGSSTASGQHILILLSAPRKYGRQRLGSTRSRRA